MRICPAAAWHGQQLARWQALGLTAPALPLGTSTRRDKAAAHAELSAQHRGLQEERRGLAADKAALEAALAEARQRAQQAETLGTGLQAECAAGRELAAALQEEAEELRGELQQVRASAVAGCLSR